MVLVRAPQSALAPATRRRGAYLAFPCAPLVGAFARVDAGHFDDARRAAVAPLEDTVASTRPVLRDAPGGTPTGSLVVQGRDDISSHGGGPCRRQ